MIARILLPCFAALICGSTLLSQEANPVRSEVGMTEAWMGQRVEISYTLLSPGSFSGTAHFQVPEIPNTLIIKHGSPTVGSETIDGESLITQRHEFSVYTQQVGTLEIPAFPIEFESKEGFIGDSVARSGTTSPLTFHSKRPPGTEALPFVVTSKTLSVKATWSPSENQELKAGDLLTRSIVREATDISAMFLEPYQAEPIDGVRIYSSDPEVVDKQERGVTTARRVDVLKYQFERGGTFTIPEITESWWNPEKQEIEQVTLEGITVSVKAPPTPPTPPDWKRISWWLGGSMVLAGLAWRFLFPPLRARYRAWHARRHSPEAEASRALVKACRQNQPDTAYGALMAWQRAVKGRDGDRLAGPLREPTDALSEALFRKGAGNEVSAWSGDALLKAFQSELKRGQAGSHRRGSRHSLPPLNPGSA